MAIDRTIIGEAAAKLLDKLDAKYGDGDEVTLSAVMLIVAIDNGDQDIVEYAAYDENAQGLAGWKGKGLLSFVNDSIKANE